MIVNKTEYKVYEKLPEGWKILDHGMECPHGYKWIFNSEPVYKINENGKAVLNPRHKDGLLKVD